MEEKWFFAELQLRRKIYAIASQVLVASCLLCVIITSCTSPTQHSLYPEGDSTATRLAKMPIRLSGLTDAGRASLPAFLKAALEKAKVAKDDSTLGRIYFYEALLEADTSEPDSTINVLYKSLEHLGRIPDPKSEKLIKTQAYLHRILTLKYKELYFYDDAAYHAQRYRELSASIKDSVNLATAMADLAILHGRLDPVSDSSLWYYQQAGESFRKLNHRHGAFTCYNNLASIFSTKNMLDSARKYSRMVREFMPLSSGDRDLIAYYHTLAEYEMATDNPGMAKAYIDSALHYSLKLGSPVEIYICHWLKAHALTQQYLPIQALNELYKAMSLARDFPSPEELKETYHLAIDLHTRLKHPDSVLKYQAALIQVLSELDHRSTQQQESAMTISAKLAKHEYLVVNQESELALRNAELVASRRLFWLLLCILVAACALALVITRSYRITLRQKHEISLKQVELENNKHELEKALRIRTRLHSILAHDFMGGLATIRSVPEVLPLVAKTGDETYITQFSEALRVKLEATHALLDGLLKWSSLQVTDEYLKLNTIKLLDLVHEVANQARPHANAKKVLLLVEQTPECRRCYVNTNEEGLRFILRNLIVNSIKFSNPEQTVLLKMGSTHPGYVCLEVIDQGVGMDENQLANLFEVERSKRRSGTVGEVSSGLGLVFVKEVADGLGIKLEVSSVVAAGTTVKVFIPKAENSLGNTLT